MICKVIQSHICQNHCSTFVNGPISMKIGITIYDLKCHFYIIEKFCDFFTLRHSDQNTTLTYILMDNFCPCFNVQFRQRYYWCPQNKKRFLVTYQLVNCSNIAIAVLVFSLLLPI